LPRAACATHGSITFDARSSAIIRSFSVTRTSSRERRSERSYLFTMSDITRPHVARRQHDGCGIVFDGRALDVRSGDRTKIPRSTREWWSQTGSNRRPPACKAGALPTELWPRRAHDSRAAQTERENMVGLGRLELPTSRLSSARSNQLSYKPLILTNGRILRRGIPVPARRNPARARP
jgi:hypothetical protein